MRPRNGPRLDSRLRAIVAGVLAFVIFGAVAVAASMMVGEIAADSLFVFVVIGVLITWGCVEETLSRIRLNATARRIT